jgi:AsmA protein
MKKILIALCVLVVLIIAAVVAVPLLVPADRMKSELIAQVKAATGRDLSIGGKVSVSVFPSVSVQMADVALANPPGFTAKTLAHLDGLSLSLKVLPLLSGKVEIGSFVLDNPTIALEIDRQGHPDWVFGETGQTPPPAAAPAAPKGGVSGPSPLSDINLGDVRIDNGKLTYQDDRAGTSEAVDAINLAVSLKSLDDPLSVKGSLQWRGKPVTLTLDMAKPRVLVDGRGTTAAGVNVAADPVKLTFAGDLAGADKAATGTVDLSVPSVRALAAWTTGKPFDFPGNGLGPLAIKGKLSAAGTHIAFSQADIALDSIKATGDVSIDAASPPVVKGRLDVDTLDLNPYLPPPEAAKGGESKPAVGGKPAPAGHADWSDAPIDASGLKSAEVDFALTANAIKVQRIQVGKSALTLALHGGKLTADLTQLTLYKGVGNGRVAVDGTQPGVGVDAVFSLKDLQAGPFLTDAAGFDRLDGTGNADIQVAGRGRSERQIVSSLAGKGSLTFLNGAIKGINLAAMLRNVATAFTDTGGPQKTDFAKLAGTFTIANGIVTNRDTALESPLLRVAAAGTVDLPKRTVNYRVEPKVVASVEGQGGKTDLAGLTVPVIVEGPWDNLSYRPDLAALAKGAAGAVVKGVLGGGPVGAIGGAAASQLPLSKILPTNPFGR